MMPNKDTVINQKTAVGYMAVSKASWITPKIRGIMDAAVSSLKTLHADILHADSLICDEAEAEKICAEFRKNDLSAIIIHFATFPVGAVIPAIAQGTQAPILLFANPEPPMTGGPLERNSFCGANMAAHILSRMNRKYDFVFGAPEDAAKIMAGPIKTLSAINQLRSTRIGLVGGRVPGFYTSNCDEMKLRAKLGVSVEAIDLLEPVAEAGRIADSAEAVDSVRKSAARYNVSDKEVEQAAKLFLAFKYLAEKYRLSAFAVRCWPELSDTYGIAPCSALGMLNDSNLTTACEGDVPGAVTMQIQKMLAGGEIPFFADLISFEPADNTAVLWHCGAAPTSLCRNFNDTALRRHFRVDGGDKKGVTNEFPLKPGRVTLARLDETRDGYQMLIAAGAALNTDQIIRGNPLRVKFDNNIGEMISAIIKKGFSHHYALVHADIKNELIAFCEFLDIKPVIME